MTYTPTSTFVFINSESKVLLGLLLYQLKSETTKENIVISVVATIVMAYIMRQFFFIYLFLFVIMLLLLFVDFRLTKRVGCIAKYLGAISLTWYLVHQNIGYSLLYHFCPSGEISFEWIVLPVIVTFVLALLTYYLAEILNNIIKINR